MIRSTPSCWSESIESLDTVVSLVIQKTFSYVVQYSRKEGKKTDKALFLGAQKIYEMVLLSLLSLQQMHNS